MRLHGLPAQCDEVAKGKQNEEPNQVGKDHVLVDSFHRCHHLYLLGHPFNAKAVIVRNLLFVSVVLVFIGYLCHRQVLLCVIASALNDAVVVRGRRRYRTETASGERRLWDVHFAHDVRREDGDGGRGVERVGLLSEKTASRVPFIGVDGLASARRLAAEVFDFAD